MKNVLLILSVIGLLMLSAGCASDKLKTGHARRVLINSKSVGNFELGKTFYVEPETAFSDSADEKNFVKAISRALLFQKYVQASSAEKADFIVRFNVKNVIRSSRQHTVVIMNLYVRKKQMWTCSGMIRSTPEYDPKSFYPGILAAQIGIMGMSFYGRIDVGDRDGLVAACSCFR